MSGSQMPSDLFRSLDAAQDDPIEKVLAALPILPPVIRYYDDFDDCVRSISDPEDSGSFEYVYDGAKGAFDFARFGTTYGLLLKHVFAFVLGEDFSISTGLHTVTGGLHISRDEMASVLSATPTGILRQWMILRSRDLPMTAYSCVKTVLRMLCRHRLNGWSESYLEFLSGLPWPARDAHAGVRSGDVFLSVEEEACIVRYLDSIADQVATESGNAAGALPSALDEAAMVLCAYQFGMRPVQIAKLQMRNVRIWHDGFVTLPRWSRRILGMKNSRSLYHGHRFPAAVISCAVRWYFRFQLSLRDIEELLFERGIVVSYETVRRWCDKFGAGFAHRVKAVRRKPGNTWHLDELFVTLRGDPYVLWRAVDEHGAELDILPRMVTSNSPTYGRANSSTFKQDKDGFLARFRFARKGFRSFLQAVAAAVEFKRMAVMHESVQDRAAHGVVAEVGAPVLNDAVGRNHYAAAQLVSLMNEGLQQSAGGVRNRARQKQIIQNQQIAVENAAQTLFLLFGFTEIETSKEIVGFKILDLIAL
ncbi:hypothetical protein GGD68_008660 [Paraburkholderia fungorum]|nr:hypothetical protein [Paraburkholderia fungorum]